MYIIVPDRPDEDVPGIIERYSKVVTDGGGVVLSADPWEGGRRRLAYPIAGRHEGIYILMQFESGPDIPKELERVFGISDDIIRSMVVRAEEVGPVEPKLTVVPAPAPTPAPEPAVVVEPVAEPAPAPEPAPEPAAEPVAEPAIEPAPEPATEA